MKNWIAEPRKAGTRRLAGLLRHRRAPLLVAVLFGALFSGGVVLGSMGAAGPHRGAPVNSVMGQPNDDFLDGSGYDEDRR